MNQIVLLLLTIYGIWAILYTVKKQEKKVLPKIKYSQTRIHSIISSLLPEGIEIKRVSQTTKLKEKNTFRVLVVGPTAYWVNNNVFYQANVEEGDDFTNMDNKEIAKMLDILDHLKNGKRNEGRSTGNQ
jgi:hypothetical protein